MELELKNLKIDRTARRDHRQTGHGSGRASRPPCPAIRHQRGGGCDELD